MRGNVRKCISLLLTLMMLLTAAPAAAGAESGAGVGWSDGEEGFAVRIMSYGGDVSRVTAGETFSVQFWIKQSNPAAVSVPLRWDPSIVTVVDASTGEPVSTGRKTERDLVRGAGFRPGEACYDNSLNENYEALYWNGKPVYAEGDGTGASGYPYINNETGFAKFLYMTNSPTLGSEEQMFLTVYFKALGTGSPNLHFATSADGSSPEEFDPGSPKGMQVSFTDRSDGNIDAVDKVESETYTGKVKFPTFRVTDGSEMDQKPVVPPATITPGAAGTGGGTAPDEPAQPEAPAEARLIPASHLASLPYGGPGAECTAQIRRSDSEKILLKDEYEVTESSLYEASAKAAAASAGTPADGSGSTGPKAEGGAAGRVGHGEKNVLVRMPEQVIDKAEYAVSLPAAPILAMKEAGVSMVYLETPLGYVGVDSQAASGKLKSDSILRVSVKPAANTSALNPTAAASSGPAAAATDAPAIAGAVTTTAGAAVIGVAGTAGVSGISVSLQINGAETSGFSGPALRLLIPYRLKSKSALPVVTTDKPFGYAGAKAPLSICRYDGEREMLLVQSPAGGTLTIEENQPLAFSDLGTAAWAKEDIDRLSQRGIISGTGQGAFSPEDNVTREQFAKMVTAALGLYQANPKMPFKDIERSNPFYYYIASANAKGIASGVSADRFDGESRISRQDLAVIVYKACEAARIRLPEITTAPVFADDNTIEGYAKNAVYALARAGIISGVGEGRFHPEGSATRAEAARILGAVYELTDQLL